MSDDTTKPWYRQFWCWFVFAPLGLWVVAMTGTVVLVSGGTDDVVAGDYGRMGKAYTESRSRHDAAASLGLRARMHLQREPGRISLALQGDWPDGQPDSLRVTLVHPTDAAQDVGAELRAQGGVYRGAFAGAVDNRRYVLIQPASGDWQLRGELPAYDTELTLTADGAADSG